MQLTPKQNVDELVRPDFLGRNKRRVVALSVANGYLPTTDTTPMKCWNAVKENLKVIVHAQLTCISQEITHEI